MRKLLTAYLCLLSLIALVLYASFASLMYQHQFFARRIKGEIMLTDFVNHYNAGLLSRRCLSGDRVSIYDPKVQWQSQLAITAPIVPDKPFYLQYPPYFFALALPLSLVNVELAWIGWTVLGVSLLAYCLLYLLRDVTSDRLCKSLVLMSVLVSYPTWLSVGMGQTALFNFAAVVAVLAALKSAHYLRSGIMESIIWIKLQYAPLTWLVGAVVGRSRFLLGFALSMLVLFGYTIAVLGIENVLAFPNALITFERSGSVSGVSPTTMQNIRGALAILFGGDSDVIRYIALGIFVFALAAIAFLWLKFYLPKEGDQRAFELLTCVTVPVLLFTSLHSHSYDYILMSIPCIWLSNSITSESRRKALLALSFGFVPLSWLFAAAKPVFQMLRVQPELTWALCVWIIALIEFKNWRSSRPQP